jgi:hypothetical protein
VELAPRTGSIVSIAQLTRPAQDFKMTLRLPILGFALLLASATLAVAQTPTPEQSLIQLSKDKWQWLADKNVDKLAPLFHDRAKFVHMGGTWNKDREIEIIKSGFIWYKQADVHDVAPKCSTIPPSSGAASPSWRSSAATK